MSKDFELERVPINSDGVVKYKKTIDNLFVNGGSIINCFKINNYSSFSEELKKGENDLDNLFYNIFSSETINQSIPEFKINDGIAKEYGFEFLNKETIFNELLNLLINGGAYKKFEQDKGLAEQLVNDCLNQIIDNRYNDFKIYFSYEPWNNWYYDVAWDYTIIFIDLKMQQLWLFCITDSD